MCILVLDFFVDPIVFHCYCVLFFGLLEQMCAKYVRCCLAVDNIHSFLKAILVWNVCIFLEFLVIFFYSKVELPYVYDTKQKSGDQEK